MNNRSKKNDDPNGRYKGLDEIRMTYVKVVTIVIKT